MAPQVFTSAECDALLSAEERREAALARLAFRAQQQAARLKALLGGPPAASAAQPAAPSPRRLSPPPSAATVSTSGVAAAAKALPPTASRALHSPADAAVSKLVHTARSRRSSATAAAAHGARWSGDAAARTEDDTEADRAWPGSSAPWPLPGRAWQQRPENEHGQQRPLSWAGGGAEWAEVEVPAGLGAGAGLDVRLPDGSVSRIRVPEGAGAGSWVQVRHTRRAAAACRRVLAACGQLGAGEAGGGSIRHKGRVSS